jgi:23S rRNA-intervening sequence protein
MNKLNPSHTTNSTPPLPLLPVLQKVKALYLIWYRYYQEIPKTHRYSLGTRIDTFFIEIMEAIAVASFLSKTEKQPYVRLAIRKVDTLKILLMILWETKSLDNKKYIVLSVPLEEIGKMLGGWNGQLTKSLDIARDKSIR